MKSFFALLLVSLLLSGCDSRSDSDGSSTDGATTEFPDLGQALGLELTVRAISDANSIETGGVGIATITALVKNSSNQAVSGAPVEFAATGGVLQGASESTDENGEAQVSLRLAGDHRNQDITVTVSSDVATASVLINASGTELDVAGPSSVVLGDSVELAITLTAGNQQPLSNQQVQLTSSANNMITPATVTTDSNGQAQITVDTTNGDDTITAIALDGSVTAIHQLVVASDILSFVTPEEGTEFEVGSINEIRVEWLREGQPVAGEDLRFGITAGEVMGGTSVRTTTAAGRAAVNVRSNSAGPATVSVVADSSGDPATQIEIEFVATAPGNVAVQSSSTRVPTEGSSTITALVTDINGNPVKNTDVDFSSSDLKGGQLNPASARTNSEGQASVSFTAGSVATEFEEIEIFAEVSGANIGSSSKLTVVERVLNITLGTSGLLDVIAGETQYGLPFAVQVADGGGTPLENAQVQISIRPTEYQKGYYYVAVDANGSPKEWARDVTVVCASEDLNGNRILDAGEDVNGNGILDPQDPALIAAHETEEPSVIGGVINTDSNGSGYFTVVYPASSSLWSQVDVTARAQALGVEAEEVFHTTLPVSAERVKSLSSTPPNSVSPYGTSSSCADEL